jgi:dCMP deaminase
MPEKTGRGGDRQGQEIIATGYNGAPRGVIHCEQWLPARPAENPVGRAPQLCRGIHAEQNAIIQASVHGVSIEGSDIYITHSPCIHCSKMLNTPH